MGRGFGMAWQHSIFSDPPSPQRLWVWQDVRWMNARLFCAARDFGGVSDLQLVQAKIGEMALGRQQCIAHLPRCLDRGCCRSRYAEAAMAKYHATEAAQEVGSAVQVFGGKGVTKGYVVESISGCPRIAHLRAP